MTFVEGGNLNENGGELILGRKRLGKRNPFSFEPGAAVPEVEQHRLGQAEPQRQLHQEKYDQGYVGRSADNAKECGRHGRADEISDNSVMGAGPALGCSWAKSNPEHAPIIRNRCIAIATPFHGQNSLIITWIGAAPPPLGQLRPISSSPQVARQCSSKGHSGPKPLERAVMTASTEWESPWDLAASVAPEPNPRVSNGELDIAILRSSDEVQMVNQRIVLL